MISIATNCTEDLKSKVEGLDEFGGKIFSIYDEGDLMDKSKFMSLPAVGLLYQGIFSSSGQDLSRQGLMGSLQVAIILIIDGKSASLDRKDTAATLLDAIRSAILTTKSPTGHKWQFVSESPLGLISSVLVYQQRWQTAAPLTN